MQAFTVHKGLVAPMDRDNVDTDAIIPKQFLKSIERSGFGQNLFDAWRYLDPGEPGQDPASRKPNPDFVLNQARYAGASVLLARSNFGCGSSREHAVWALAEWGIRAVIAESFGVMTRDRRSSSAGGSAPSKRFCPGLIGRMLLRASTAVVIACR